MDLLNFSTSRTTSPRQRIHEFAPRIRGLRDEIRENVNRSLEATLLTWDHRSMGCSCLVGLGSEPPCHDVPTKWAGRITSMKSGKWGGLGKGVSTRVQDGGSIAPEKAQVDDLDKLQLQRRRDCVSVLRKEGDRSSPSAWGLPGESRLQRQSGTVRIRISLSREFRLRQYSPKGNHHEAEITRSWMGALRSNRMGGRSYHKIAPQGWR